MRGKLLFVAGAAIGYVIGARAGRPAYDALVERAHGAAESPAVRHAAETAKDALEAKAPELADVAEKTASVVAGAATAASEVGTGSSDADPGRAGSSKPEPSKPSADAGAAAEPGA